MTKHQANATEGVIEFLRKKDYILVRELGQGACGKTVLLRDDGIGEQFVCKKYAPFSEAHRESLFQNFVNEIKLLLRANHPNIVRVFNYYLFPERFAGFILMEHVDGQDIETFLSTQPERTNDVFVQVIDGFRYLESNQILHRDIRPANILVRADGVVKIIDLGFREDLKNPRK